MHDSFQRNINYLRISVTDKCNLRCVYCMPEQGVELTHHGDILRLEEIALVVKSAVISGIRKVRFTGGEPLVRKGIIDLIGMVHEIPEIDDIALTTNGVLLPEMALSLKKAGLNRVNISLDTLSAEKFSIITRGGDLSQVWRGISSALEAGLAPVKINTVAMKGFNDDEIDDFVDLTGKYPLHIRFIELMPIGASEAWAAGKYISTAELMETICNKHNLLPVKEVAGCGPARYYRVPGAPGTIGFISPISDHFCAACNRLRLTSEGQLRPCLQSPSEYDLRTPLRAGATPKELAVLIQKVIDSKPEKHDLTKSGWEGNKRVMTQIGG
jgi:cyclic pyranopterin phosphate synthase